MTDKKKRTQPTRRSVGIKKAEKLVNELGAFALSDEATERVTPVHGEQPTPSTLLPGEERVVVLKHEIDALKIQLAHKTKEYRELVPKSAPRESGVVVRVLAMLMQNGGTTKEKLMAETGAKKGYIDALLNRILPSRGCNIISSPVEGTRIKAYRIKPDDNLSV